MTDSLALMNSSTRDEQSHRSRPFIARRRVQYASALLIGGILPWALRGVVQPQSLAEMSSLNTLLGNVVAITIAFWMRLSVEVYPGIRRSYIILPAALAGHGAVLAWFVMTRFPYDRIALTAGFILHVVWLFILYIYAERRIERRVAVVPFGGAERLFGISGVNWRRLKRPRLHDTRGCDAIVADFGADLPDEWEAFLADAALAGKVVYQHKQLAESLTGRVELERLSENSFGSLVPVRGYFYLKSVLDVTLAVLLLPLAIPIMAIIAVAIRLDSKGPAFFSQRRIGFAGREITVYKFRTMRYGSSNGERDTVITRSNDARITPVGRWLRKWRLDELPQIINILKFEMSWIGPRPEAKALADWYASELPFYDYRHVVKPGISGWAQVNQGHVADVGDVDRKLQYDFYYIKYFSPWLDVLISLRTIKTILTGFGSK